MSVWPAFNDAGSAGVDDPAVNGPPDVANELTVTGLPAVKVAVATRVLLICVFANETGLPASGGGVVEPKPRTVPSRVPT